MIQSELIKGIIFDYGGTIDSDGLHWAEVIWDVYLKERTPVSRDDFREAYVYGERTLGKNRLILPHHTFRDMMHIKIDLQLKWLEENQRLHSPIDLEVYSQCIAEKCYLFARDSVNNARPILKKLYEKYPLILVSNFYGNIESVLRDFRLDHYFRGIVESAVVGIRKPDPAIFRLGVEKLNLLPNQTVVIGDSYDKDILPATTLGCQTIWLKNIGWNEYNGEEKADVIIAEFTELNDIFK